MPIQVSQPNSDVLIQWPFKSGTGGTHVSRVDESIALKDNTDWVEVRGQNKHEQYGYLADGPGDMETITQVEVVLYMKATVDAFIPGLTIRILSSDGLTIYGSIDFLVDTEGGWLVLGFPIPVNMTKTQYNDSDVDMLSFQATGDEPGPWVYG